MAANRLRSEAVGPAVAIFPPTHVPFHEFSISRRSRAIRKKIYSPSRRLAAAAGGGGGCSCSIVQWRPPAKVIADA